MRGPSDVDGKYMTNSWQANTRALYVDTAWNVDATAFLPSDYQDIVVGQVDPETGGTFPNGQSPAATANFFTAFTAVTHGKFFNLADDAAISPFIHP